MRSMRRVALTVLIALAFAAPAAARTHPPTLTIIRLEPQVTVHGIGFKPHELVRVNTTLTHASLKGTFTLTIPGGPVSRCGGLTVRAVARSGTASAKIPLAMATGCQIASP
jgi:hypothetical protein